MKTQYFPKTDTEGDRATRSTRHPHRLDRRRDNRFKSVDIVSIQTLDVPLVGRFSVIDRAIQSK